AVLAATAVAHEKDRRTLILLLLTNLSNWELVLGKLLASLLNVFVMLAAAAPLFMALALLGGISFTQIGWTYAVVLVGVLTCGSLGSLVALWREKTFQALTLTVLILVLWIVGWEIVAAGLFGSRIAGISCVDLAAGFSPWQAMLKVIEPGASARPELEVFGSPLNLYLVFSAATAVLLNALAAWKVRVWNPSREALPAEKNESLEKQYVETHSSQTQVQNRVSANVSDAVLQDDTRAVWDNPVIWREIRTWAYGRKILAIRLGYLLLFALAAASLAWITRQGELGPGNNAAYVMAPLFLLSLMLLNVQAVTSITSERDVGALDLLLVTDLTPKEIVFGKLGGVFYNTKEMIVLPLVLCAYLWIYGDLGLENLIFLIIGLSVFYVFVAVLGIHSGMTYANSGSAIGASLGTLVFLTIGVASCMWIMLAFSGSFQAQFVPFFAYMVLGGVGLYVVLGVRNPSTAIGAASFICPFATFYAITSYLLGATLGMFLSLVGAYGFTIAAMLVPAIYEFDIATGRTSTEE
ncbi:MAG: ABC transporter permease subunit, partial [Thermoguttaceae bacterium]